jgi:hypothetical protein
MGANALSARQFLPLVHDDHVVGDAHYKIDVVLDHQHRHSSHQRLLIDPIVAVVKIERLVATERPA